MAELYKQRMRKYLAKGALSFGRWAKFDVGPRFLIVLGEYQLQLSREEAANLVATLEERLTDPELRRAEGLPEKDLNL